MGWRGRKFGNNPKSITNCSSDLAALPAAAPSITAALEKNRGQNYGAENSAKVLFAAERGGGGLAAGGAAHAALKAASTVQIPSVWWGGGVLGLGGAAPAAVWRHRGVLVQTFFQTSKNVAR